MILIWNQARANTQMWPREGGFAADSPVTAFLEDKSTLTFRAQSLPGTILQLHLYPGAPWGRQGF